MKRTVLITGAGPNGVTGRRIKSALSTKYNILSPDSKALDLTDFAQVKAYFENHDIDFIIHGAIFRNNVNSMPQAKEVEIERNLRMYYNLAHFANKVEKFIYFGSGAEYDKSRDIIKIKEEEFGRRIPCDSYGFWKYIISQHAMSTDNIYNLRVFGTINPLERPSKNVISNLCAKAAIGHQLELLQDCRFSFIDIDDVIRIIDYAFVNDTRFRNYNVTSTQSYLLSDVAKMINEISDGKFPVIFRKEGMNKEYTADNSRLTTEFNSFTKMEESLIKVYTEMKARENQIDVSQIDGRWKGYNLQIAKNITGGGRRELDYLFMVA